MFINHSIRVIDKHCDFVLQIYQAELIKSKLQKEFNMSLNVEIYDKFDAYL